MSEESDAAETERAFDSFRREILALPDYEAGGWELMERIEAWSHAWPGHVETAGCDDHGCASSDLWPICHRWSNGVNTAVSMLHVPQCHGNAWEPFRLSMGALTRFHEALVSPPAAAERRLEKGRPGIKDWLTANVTIVRGLSVTFNWKLDQTLISAWVSGPPESGSSFLLYPEHLPGLIEALQRTRQEIEPSDSK